MSADAKVWDDARWWYGIHDGSCRKTTKHDGYSLSSLLKEIEGCMEGHELRWETIVYPDGNAGLRGFLE